MRLRMASRLSAVLVLGLASTGVTVAAAGAAQARPQSCGVSSGYSYSSYYQSVSASAFYICAGHVTPLSVSILKDGTVVAHAYGNATYACNGSTVHRYTFYLGGGSGGPVDYPCG